MGQAVWLGSECLAEIAGISRRVATKILARASRGKSWRGAPLVVRVRQGPGGRSGFRYEVLLSSLPVTYQTALIGLSEPRSLPAVRPVPASDQGKKIHARYLMIEEALDYAPHSAERKAELERAARKWGKSVRTLQRYIQHLEEAGGDVNALAHKRPGDAGQRRVYISRQFDKAFLKAGYSADLPDLAQWLDGTIAAIWQSPAQRAGWWRVRLETLTALRRECGERGFALPQSAFTLSRRRVMENEHHRIVDIRRYDRKRYDDMKPRIRRDNSLFMPMEQIVMDVKPVDCVMLRPDGSQVWPKLIGFMDTGTHRVFSWFVMLNKGEGVRQEHVTEAFLAMVGHPQWGFPQQLYRDNGTEFYHFDLIRSALDMVAADGVRTIINAKPYSGSSKPIESKFAMLDRQVFSQMAGYAGGNRMNKKTQAVGKPTAPYPGTFEEFCEEALLRIQDFESWEIRSGPFKGKSPTQCYQEHCDNGWRPVTVNTLALDAAFSKPAQPMVRQGALSIGGTRYRHPELAALNGRKATVALPWRRGAYPLVKLPDNGWAALEPEMLHLPGDIAGAIESGRMQKHNDKTTSALCRSVKPADLRQNLQDRVTALPTSAAPAPLIDVMLSSEAEEFAGARLNAEQRRIDAPTEEQRRIARQMAETEELERLHAARRAHR